MSAGEVVFPGDGVELRGWCAAPAGGGRAPALVLVPDVRGVSQLYRGIARRFAAAGLLTLVVDLYGREGAPDLPDMDAVFRWIRALPDRRVLGDLAAAVRHLEARADVRPGAVGIAGFCLGGQYALMAACTVPGIAACVSWYGMLRYTETDAVKPESPLAMAPRLACPFLGLFGDEDALVPRADVDELRTTLARTGRPSEIVVYPGAGHAFMNDERPDAYRPEAAADSWRRAVAFFETYLPGRRTA